MTVADHSFLFEVSKLNVQAGQFKLQNISFTLQQQDYLIILGPTGCGKTMLLETLAGLRTAVSGDIRLKGEKITNWLPEHRGLGFAYQDSLLYPFLNVRENILFGAKAKNMDKDARVLKRLHQLAQAMGIEHLLKRKPNALSGGERQRVSLARAILTNPPLLLLDEPLSALDPQTRSAMRDLLQQIHQTEGMGIIHVTHDFNEALQLGNQLLVMHQGQILQQGEPGQVFNQPCSLTVANFLQCANVIEGNIEQTHGLFWFKSKEHSWLLGPLPQKPLALNSTGQIYLMLPDWQINISTVADFKQKVNCWCATVQKMVLHSTHVELICQGYGLWRVILSRAKWQTLGLQVGTKVFLTVPMEQLHWIPHCS